MVSKESSTVAKDRYKILLVDDVELFIELEKTFFRRDQFCIFTATNGNDALRMAREEQPDLIFIDLYLPEINGDEVCRRLKLDPETAQIPVIMVVQRGGESDIALSKAAGCDDILYKPVRREEFLRASREQLSLVERCAPRFDAQLLVKYGLRDERLFEQYTVNIGAGGFFMASETYLSIDTWLSLQIELPDGQPPVGCHGRVAWVNHPDWKKKPQLPHGMGVEFIDITEEQQQRIVGYLSQS
jgi:uncharacterized protein (TIGR02266 family)